MQIKTLAEILAESNSDSASHVSHSKKSSSPKTLPSGNSQPRSSKSGNSRPSHSKPSHYKSRNSKSISKLSEVEQAVEPSPPIKKSRARRQKRFHPASNYTPKDSDGNPIALENILPDIVENTVLSKSTQSQTSNDTPISIQSLLAEVRRQPIKDANSQVSLLARASDLIPNSEQTFYLLDAKEATSSDDDQKDLPSALKAYLLTPEQRHAKKEAIKAESRLRWLAFYYLSRREYGRDELRQKLIDKEQDPIKVEALLDEFAEKGYQSDWRTALMLIREGMRKGRGRQRIKQEFYRRKLPLPDNIDTLIERAQQQSDEFTEFINDNPSEVDGNEGVDWLKLAVEARVKKYGSELPTTPKDKAKQLRFLQYRGFNSDVCFDALKYNLQNLDERY